LTYLDTVFAPGGLLARRFEGYTPRQGQVDLARAVDAAIMGGEHLVAEAPTGCHAAGQGILMFDGSIKKVEDIVVGDQLMGPDSEPRNVLALARGEQEMVDVIPTKGEPWRVNLDHMLTLVRTNEGLTNRRSGRLAGQLVDVSVREVLAWSKNQKHIHKLQRKAVQFANDDRQLLLDPYFMGVILGDGALAFANGVMVTTADLEIVAMLEQQALKYKLSLRFDGKYGYRLNGEIGNKNHPIMNALRWMGLLPIACDKRFIPFCFKTANRSIRLELLAGLLDTDGSLDLNSKTGFDYISKSRQLADDVAFVARSLGLAAYVKPSQKKCPEMSEARTYYRVFISGDTSVIPCRIARKKAPPRQQIKDVLRTGFQLVRTGKAEPYYGFSLDRDGRFLLEDFTVTHNTGKSIAYSVPSIYRAVTEHLRVVIVTANIALQEQLQRKDLPLLQELMSEILPRDFSYTLLKGRSNYLCVNRLEEGYQEAPAPADHAFIKDIVNWAAHTKTGDKSELPFEPAPHVWNRFSVSSDECLGKDCDYYEQCYANAANKAAQEADVIVTNYHLFFADMQVRDMTGDMAFVLPPYDVAIMDEGHKAVDIARSFFGSQVTEGAVKRAIGLLPANERAGKDDTIERFFAHLRQLRRLPSYKARLRQPGIIAADELLTALEHANKWYAAEWKNLDHKSEECEPDERRSLRRRMRKLAQRTRRALEITHHIEAANTLAPPERPQDWRVHFIEEDGDKIKLCSSPVHVAERLQESLFSQVLSTTTTSATLAAKGSFDFVVSELGVERPNTLLAASPFRWGEQALLVTPSGLPDPSRERMKHEALVTETCARVVEEAEGRTLALFTTRKAIDAAYRRLLPLSHKYRILRQGEMPRTQLIDIEPALDAAVGNE